MRVYIKLYISLMIKVYLIEAELNDNKLYKIGFTRRNIEERIKELKTGNASNFTIINQYESKWGTKIEAYLHRLYDQKKINGEWFNLTNDDVKDFYSICEKIDNNFNVIEELNSYYQEKGKF